MTTRDRTNAEWLAELRSFGEPMRETAVAELAKYLRSGLAKAFAGQSGVDESDLEDFTQDAVMRVLGSLDTFRGESRLTTWAMAVGLRVAYTALRKRRSSHISLEDLADFEARIDESISISRAPRADRQTERNDLVAALRSAINERLSARQRAAILAELEGVSSDRAAALLGTNRNALYKVYHDARKNLRRALNEHGFSDEDVRQELMEGVR